MKVVRCSKLPPTEEAPNRNGARREKPVKKGSGGRPKKRFKSHSNAKALGHIRSHMLRAAGSEMEVIKKRPMPCRPFLKGFHFYIGKAGSHTQ